MTLADRRIGIINKIRRSYHEAAEKGLVIDEEKLIALLGIDEGVARRTAIEYIRSARIKFAQDMELKEQDKVEADKALLEARDGAEIS